MDNINKWYNDYIKNVDLEKYNGLNLMLTS